MALKKWENFSPMVEFLRKRHFFDPHAAHSGLLSAAITGDVVDSELHAEWRRYSQMCPAPLVVGDPDFWDVHAKEFPCFTALARRFRAVPPSSSVVERSFSILKDMQDPRRTRMTEEYVRTECSLRFNYLHLVEYVRGAIQNPIDKV